MQIYCLLSCTWNLSVYCEKTDYHLKRNCILHPRDKHKIPHCNTSFSVLWTNNQNKFSNKREVSSQLFLTLLWFPNVLKSFEIKIQKKRKKLINLIIKLIHKTNKIIHKTKQTLTVVYGYWKYLKNSCHQFANNFSEMTCSASNYIFNYFLITSTFVVVFTCSGKKNKQKKKKTNVNKRVNKNTKHKIIWSNYHSDQM